MTGILFLFTFLKARVSVIAVIKCEYSCFSSCQDPRWDRWTWNQDLPPSWRRVRWGWRLQRADSHPEGKLLFCKVCYSRMNGIQWGDVNSTIFWFECHILMWMSDWTKLLLFSRPASRLPWWAPTSRLRPRGRRWGAACTPGAWWRWRIQSTTTSSSCGSCWCEWQRGSDKPQLSLLFYSLLS